MDSSLTNSSVVEFVNNTLLNKEEFFNKYFNKIIDHEIKKNIVGTFPDLTRSSLSELLGNMKEVLSEDMSKIEADILEDDFFTEFIDEKKDSYETYERMDVNNIVENSVLFKDYFEFNAFKKMFISMKRNEPEKLKEIVIENTNKIYQNLIDIFTVIDESGIV